MAIDPKGFRRVTNAPTFDCPRCGRESRWDRSRAVAWYTMNCTVCIDCFESMRAEEPAADKPFDGATPRTSDTISHRGKGDHA